MADFLELFGSLIIAVMIFVINSWGSKKKQQAKNQSATLPPSSIEREEEAEFDVMDLTWDEMFDALRKKKELAANSIKEVHKQNEQTTKTSVDHEEYIPRATQQVPPVAQPIVQRKHEVSPKVAPTPTLKPEGGTPIEYPIQPIEANEIGDWDDVAFDPNEVDWRQSVVASEILNRKYT